jgi:ubiquitin-activating enzyme E1 C
MASISANESLNEKWKHIRRLTDRESAFAHPAFEPGVENFDAIQQCRVLVVGSGGLGCEILKGLALSGFKHIETIDMDTIDLSNLNRQFLFREADIGKSKAEVAANFVNNRVNDVQVAAHNCKIQDKDLNFYRQFSIVICGLDSIVARRWLNATICSIVQFDSEGNPDPSTIIPLVDGGTEGFKGNARVVFPFFSPCIECTLDLYPPQINFPLCTIAHTPRLPEHCIEYVKVILWDEKKPFGDESIDGDSPEHLTWIMNRAQERAKEFNIIGVDFRLTQGVVKRIIPAVASTNEIIAGSCVLEALKLASNIGCPLDNYLNFSNIDGAFFGPVKL